MHRPTRQLRGLFVALATLGLSAGVALAARPTSAEAPASAAGDGLRRASEAAGKTVPVQPKVPALPQADEPDGDARDDAAPKAAEGERAQNHGWFVSEAAKLPTPAGFDNHGQYVSGIARGDQGKPEAATAARETGSAAAEAAKDRKAERSPQNAKAGKP